MSVIEYWFGIIICFSCIGLLDRFLQQCVTSPNASNNGFVTQKNLQLIAVATFLIAAKVEVSVCEEMDCLGNHAVNS